MKITLCVFCLICLWDILRVITLTNFLALRRVGPAIDDTFFLLYLSLEKEVEAHFLEWLTRCQSHTRMQHADLVWLTVFALERYSCIHN